MSRPLRRIGFVVGLPQEAAILRQGLESPNLLVFCSGAKSSRIPSGVADLLANGADALISFGFAGAASPQWKAGDIVVAGLVVAPDGTEYRPEPGLSLLISGALEKAGIASRPGTVVGVDRVIASASDKQRLAGAHAAATIDMESHAMAQAAQGRPFAVLRVVLDPADRSIPASVLGALDKKGAIRPLALIGALLRAPGEIAGLLALARDHAAAQRSLRRAAAGLRGVLRLV